MQPALTYSLVIPVYRNEDNIPTLLAAIGGLRATLGPSFEVIFVVDGSPDASHAHLRSALPTQGFSSTLVSLARNFGAFAAIRHGLGLARGHNIAVMAADLQEPPELVAELLGRCVMAVTLRSARGKVATTRRLPNCCRMPTGPCIAAG